ANARPTNDLTGASVHNSASARSNNASLRAVKQPYRSNRNRDNTRRDSTGAASLCTLNSTALVAIMNVSATNMITPRPYPVQPPLASTINDQQEPRGLRINNKLRDGVPG